MNSLTKCTEVLPLRWGEPVAQLSPPFDLVLASDVAYDAACVPALISTFAALCGPATRGLLAFEARPPVTDMAVALLQQHGLVGTPVCVWLPSSIDITASAVMSLPTCCLLHCPPVIVPWVAGFQMLSATWCFRAWCGLAPC